MSRLAGVLLLLPSVMVAQQSIRVVADRQISTSAPDVHHYESFLAVNPANPAHMIAMSMVQPPSSSGSAMYATFDGGRTWQTTRFAPTDSFLPRGGDGVVYFASSSLAVMAVGTKVNGESKTVVAISRDGGRTFGRSVVLPYRDRPWIAFDQNGILESLFTGSAYLVGQLDGMVFSRSNDGGVTWTYADLLNRDEGGADRTAPVGGIAGDIVVMPKGEVVIPFVPFVEEGSQRPTRTGTDSLYARRLNLLVSDNGGRTWQAVRKGPLSHHLISFRASRALSSFRTTVDLSRGPHRGQILVTSVEYDEPSDRYVVVLHRTKDLGQTWQSTVVNDDRVGHEPSNAAVTVNKDGVVAVTWYDRRDDPNGECWRLYGAISTDGGDHFRPNVKLSDVPTCTNQPQHWVLSSWNQLDSWSDSLRPHAGFGLSAFVPVRFPNGGETMGLAADRDGAFNVAWTNGVGGGLHLWYTKFVVEPSVLAEARAGSAAAVGMSRDTLLGREDLSLELKFEMSDPVIDFKTGTLAVTMRVVNSTAHPVAGPMDVRLDRFVSPRSEGMGLKGLRVANATNGLSGVGAVWRLSLGPNDVLQPGGKTAPKRLVFAFDGGVPKVPQGYFEPWLTIFAKRLGQ